MSTVRPPGRCAQARVGVCHPTRDTRLPRHTRPCHDSHAITFPSIQIQDSISLSLFTFHHAKSANGKDKPPVPFSTHIMLDPPFPPRTHRLLLGRYRLLNAFPNVLILLPTVAAPPSCMLLASASSSADWVTDASSRSLKLLPILGVPVPSLPSLPIPFPFPLPAGLLPASSAVRRGDSGWWPPLGCRFPPAATAGWWWWWCLRCGTAAELVDESLVCDCCGSAVDPSSREEDRKAVAAAVLFGGRLWWWCWWWWW